MFDFEMKIQSFLFNSNIFNIREKKNPVSVEYIQQWIEIIQIRWPQRSWLAACCSIVVGLRFLRQKYSYKKSQNNFFFNLPPGELRASFYGNNHCHFLTSVTKWQMGERETEGVLLKRKWHVMQRMCNTAVTWVYRGGKKLQSGFIL